MRVIDTASFIAKSKLIHGEKYKYPNTIYKKSILKVEIECDKHGVFLITPNAHLNGQGCRQCGIEKKSKLFSLGKDEWLKRCFEHHGDKYSYMNAIYINSSKDVYVTCREHGDFLVKPSTHVSGGDCPKCTKYEFIDFLKDAIDIHGSKYKYIECEIESKYQKIKIICREHGEFMQSPRLHIDNKCGCPRCGNSVLKTKDEFIFNSTIVHGKKYIYENVVYAGNKKKVEIICESHGSFWQIPSCHLSGKGCPSCASESRTSFRRSHYINNCKDKYHGLSSVYLIKCWNENEFFYKVGITCTKLDYRFKKSKMPYQYEILSSISMSADKAWDDEKILHSLLSDLKYSPLIKFGGSASECFIGISSDVAAYFGVEL